MMTALRDIPTEEQSDPTGTVRGASQGGESPGLTSGEALGQPKAEQFHILTVKNQSGSATLLAPGRTS